VATVGDPLRQARGGMWRRLRRSDADDVEAGRAGVSYERRL